MTKEGGHKSCHPGTRKARIRDDNGRWRLGRIRHAFQHCHGRAWPDHPAISKRRRALRAGSSGQARGQHQGFSLFFKPPTQVARHRTSTNRFPSPLRGGARGGGPRTQVVPVASPTRRPCRRHVFDMTPPSSQGGGKDGAAGCAKPSRSSSGRPTYVARQRTSTNRFPSPLRGGDRGGGPRTQVVHLASPTRRCAPPSPQGGG